MVIALFPGIEIVCVIVSVVGILLKLFSPNIFVFCGSNAQLPDLIVTRSSIIICFTVSQMVKNPPAMRETWVRSLAWEGPLEKGKATHSSILACRISWTVCSPWDRKESDTTERLSLTK